MHVSCVAKLVLYFYFLYLKCQDQVIKLLLAAHADLNKAWFKKGKTVFTRRGLKYGDANLRLKVCNKICLVRIKDNAI